MRHSKLRFLFSHNRPGPACLGSTMLALLLCLQSPCLAAETQAANDKVASSSPQKDFEYIMESRKDPFMPFLSAKATSNEVEPDEIVEKKIKLTGMQLFEPGQLNLVALLNSGARQFAMVEDFTGKGYIISVGTKIGRRGTVKEIAPNKVIIEETAQTRSGKKLVTNTVMVLKKEGEE